MPSCFCPCDVPPVARCASEPPKHSALLLETVGACGCDHSCMDPQMRVSAVTQYQGMVEAMVEAAQLLGAPGEPLLSVEL